MGKNHREAHGKYILASAVSPSTAIFIKSQKAWEDDIGIYTISVVLPEIPTQWNLFKSLMKLGHQKEKSKFREKNGSEGVGTDALWIIAF